MCSACKSLKLSSFDAYNTNGHCNSLVGYVHCNIYKFYAYVDCNIYMGSSLVGSGEAHSLVSY